jgi:hypothetical protein
MSKLSKRTKEFEDHAATARGQSQADLEKAVTKARTSAQAQGDELRRRAESGKKRISVWWQDVQQSWNEHLSAVRKDVEDKRTAHDMQSAKNQADQADDDAAFAIDYAYAAIEEAEYAFLDAELAHKRVEAMAGST